MSSQTLVRASRAAPPLRCFIGFFGITRALEWTIQSIEHNIFAPLDAAGIRQVRAGHFNKPVTINAPRSGEQNVPFAMGDISRLRLDEILVEDQKESNVAQYLDTALAVPLRYEEDAGGRTRRHLLYQLYSLSRLNQIFTRLDPQSFDFVLLLRPDLRYPDRFPVRDLIAQLGVRPPSYLGPIQLYGDVLRRRFRPEAEIVLPIWQKHGGFNDRFAVASPAAASVYMNRIEHVPAFCARHEYIQSEELLKNALDAAGLRTAGTWVRAERIRSRGNAEVKDHVRIRDRVRWRAGLY